VHVHGGEVGGGEGMRWIEQSAPKVAYMHARGKVVRWVRRFALNVACTSCTGGKWRVDGGWMVGSQSRQTSAEFADSRFLSLAVVPLGEDGGLQ
jgi:hypothetical protein